MMTDSKKEGATDSQENEKLNGKVEHDQDQTALELDTTEAPKYKGVSAITYRLLS